MKKFTTSCLLTICTVALATAQQNITTVAGTGTGGYNGDGVQATTAEIKNPTTIVVDGAGNYYFTDESNNRIREVNTNGVISTVAGNGTAGSIGDGGAATAAEVNLPAGLAIDGSGNLYIGDQSNNKVRMVSASGIITTIAGTGTAGYTGDGGAATAATMRHPIGVAVDGSGNVYIADSFNQVIRKITKSTGVISTIAGIGGSSGFIGDGGPAGSAELNGPYGVTVDGSGNIYIADQTNNRIREINTLGVINTIAGNGTASYGGDGGPATAAAIDGPTQVSIGAAGDLLIADTYNNVVRKINVNYGNYIFTVAGNNTAGYSGDGGAATAAELHFPNSVASNSHGDIYIADWGNNRIRKVTNVDVLGVNEITESNSLSVFPNPAKDIINVNLGEVKGNVSLTLYNMLGEKVYESTVKNEVTTSIPCSSMKGGIYLLVAKTENGSTTSKKIEIAR